MRSINYDDLVKSPTSASDSNFNPRNILYIPAYPACPVAPADGTGVIEIFTFLKLEPRLNIKYGFNWASKNYHFPKVSLPKKMLDIILLSILYQINIDYFTMVKSNI